MDGEALEALYAAATAIRKLKSVAESTADSDSDSGEVIFTLKNGNSYVLKLERYSEGV